MICFFGKISKYIVSGSKSSITWGFTKVETRKRQGENCCSMCLPQQSCRCTWCHWTNGLGEGNSNCFRWAPIVLRQDEILVTLFLMWEWTKLYNLRASASICSPGKVGCLKSRNLLCYHLLVREWDFCVFWYYLKDILASIRNKHNSILLRILANQIQWYVVNMI